MAATDTGNRHSPARACARLPAETTITPVDVVEFRPTPDQFAWTFGGVAPTHRIRPGTALKLWTEDAFSGRIQRTTDRASEVLDINEVNPQTGPFFVEGAEPGDTLAIHIVDLTPARDWAASTTIPFFGALTGTDRTALLNDPLPERTWIYQLDRRGRHRPLRGGEPVASTCRSRRCWARSGWPRRAGRCAPRWCRTCSAATWTRRR